MSDKGHPQGSYDFLSYFASLVYYTQLGSYASLTSKLGRETPTRKFDVMR